VAQMAFSYKIQKRDSSDTTNMYHITPIITTTEQCNMACKYCYAGSSKSILQNSEKLNNNFKLRIPLLLDFIDQVISYNNCKTTKIIFHGGEPLLVDPRNYKSIFTYIRDEKYPIEINIQTNGTLINDDYIDLFKEFNIKIGISLDGPGSVNDRTRIFKSGNGSFSAIFQNLKKLRAKGLDFGCLLTLSRSNIDNIYEIYNFFKENSFPYNLRPIFDSFYSIPKEFLITPQEYASAFCKIFDMWFDDTEMDEILIYEFARIIAQFINPIDGLVSCSFLKDCSKHFVTFDMDGKIWPCNRLDKIPKFCYGNLNEKNLKDILINPRVKNLSTRWNNLKDTDCRNCNISNYCHGGCPANSYFYYDTYFKKDYFCGTCLALTSTHVN